MATPLLRVTNAGAAAATLATPTGPHIKIVRWKLGSGYGYEPQPEDTDLNGNVLYSDVPRSYQNVGDNTLDIICQLPPAAGPFDYGEIGLYIEDNDGNEVLFAKGVWDRLQTKESSLGTNVNSQVTFHCLLKLQQSIAVLRVHTSVAVAVWEVDRWSDVVVPTLSAHSEVPLVLVRELDNNQDSTLLQTNLPEDDSWTIGTNYDFVARTSVVNASSNSVTVPVSAVPTRILNDYHDRQLVIEIEGFSAPYRSVASVTVSGTNAILALNPAPLSSLPAVDAPVVLYEQKALKVIPLATRNVPGIVQIGNGLSINSDGLLSAGGLLHGAPGTGQVLNSSHNISQTSWGSGEYEVQDGNRPAGLPGPTTRGGRLRISSYGAHIVQEYYPMWQGADAANPNNQAWWRIWNSASGWSGWRLMGGAGSTGGGTLQYLGPLIVGVAPTISGTFVKDGQSIYMCESNHNGSGGGYRIGLAMYINGIQIMRQGHADTFGTQGGAGLSATGQYGMTYTLEVHGWFEGYSGFAYTIIPNT